MKSLKEYQEERNKIVETVKIPDSIVSQIKQHIVIHFTKEIEKTFDRIVKSGAPLYYSLQFLEVHEYAQKVYHNKAYVHNESMYFEKELTKLVNINEVVHELTQTFEELGFKTNITEFNDLIIEE